MLPFFTDNTDDQNRRLHHFGLIDVATIRYVGFVLTRMSKTIVPVEQGNSYRTALCSVANNLSLKWCASAVSTLTPLSTSSITSSIAAKY